jgi:hypothetical protein
MPLLYGEGGLKAFRRLHEAIIQKSYDHSLLSWRYPKDLDDNNDRFLAIGLLADSPAQFEHSGGVAPVPTGTGYPSFSLANRGLYINIQIDRPKFPKAPNMWLDCAEQGSPNRIAIALQYSPRTDTYCINRRCELGSISVPFNAARETILLDDLSSYSTFYRSSGPAAFVLQPRRASKLHGFQLQQIYPDAGWISRSQVILPFEKSPGDWRLGVILIRTQPERSEIAIIAGLVVCEEGQRISCALVQCNHESVDLEVLVRAQVPSRHAVNQSTISLGEKVVALEINNRQDSLVADSEFDVWLRFEEDQSDGVFTESSWSKEP